MSSATSVLSLLGVGDHRDPLCERLRSSCPTALSAAGLTLRYSPRPKITPATASGTRWRIGRRSATRRRIAGRRDPDLRHPHDLRPIARTQPVHGRLRLIHRRARSRGDPQPRQLEHPLRLPPALESRGDVGSQQEDEVVRWSGLGQQLKRTEGERRPVRLVSTSEASSRSSASAASPAISSLTSAPGSGSIRL